MCALLTPQTPGDSEHSPKDPLGNWETDCFFYVPVESVLPRTAAGPADGALLVYWQRIEGEPANIVAGLRFPF